MAPRALVSRIDAMVICASPKASCRSVADFAWAVRQQERLQVPMPIQLIVFRNPFRRLASAYLNKYVEHSRYREDSLARCPEARLDTFADFLEELDGHGFRCVDKVHFKPQRARYRWRRFDRVFDADDLAPLQRFVNTLCGTEEAMPFRVATNRPPTARDLPAPETRSSGGEQTSPWLLRREDLQERITAGRTPAYASFYNPSLEAMTRRIYQVDFHFLDRALRSGLLDLPLHEKLNAPVRVTPGPPARDRAGAATPPCGPLPPPPAALQWPCAGCAPSSPGHRWRGGRRKW